MRKRLIAVTAGLLSTQAIAAQAPQRWRIAAQTLREEISIDTTSISTKAGVKTVWVKKLQSASKDSTLSGAGSTTTAYSLDCAGRRVAVIEEIVHDAAGGLLESHTLNSRFILVAPESLSEILFDAVCRGKWRKTIDEAIQLQADSMALDFLQTSVESQCPKKKISKQTVVRSFRASPPKLDVDSIQARAKTICRGAA